MTELAHQRIEQEKRERSGYLDLGNCGLTELPDLSGLDWLETLVLSGRWWDWEKRKWMYSQNTGSPNRIAKFEAKRLPEGIRRIILSELKISDGSFLGTLTNLTTLDLSFNRIGDFEHLMFFIEKKGLNVVWKEWYKTGRGEVNLKDNPLVNPGVEVIQQGNTAILESFKQN